VAGGELEVRRTDIRRVVEQAQQLVLPPEREILQVLVRQFFLDGQDGIKNPLGLSGLRLEVETHIVTALSSHLRNSYRAAELAGVSVVEPVLTALASASAVLTGQERELGVLLIDIGASVTDWALFESGEVQASGVVPFGGERVTLDLAVGLGIHRDTAERVKLGRSEVEQDPAVEEIVLARMAELFEWVDAARTRAGASEVLPGGVVLTGGGSRLLGAAEVALESFGGPVSVRGPDSSVRTGGPDATLSAAWGLALWGGRSTPRRTPGTTFSEWLAASRRRLAKKR
jgi:cell division protein FtsA